MQLKDNGKLKLMVIVGTRPEITRLAGVINKVRKYFVRFSYIRGQNYDYNLNDVFFKDLGDRINREDSLLFSERSQH